LGFWRRRIRRASFARFAAVFFFKFINPPEAGSALTDGKKFMVLSDFFRIL